MPVTEIKKTARLSLKGKFVKCICTNIIYIIIMMFLSLISTSLTQALTSHAVILIIIQAIFAIVSLILSFTLIGNIISIIKNETYSIRNFFKSIFSNSGKYIKILLQIILRLIIPIVIFIICYFYFFGTYFAYSTETNFLCFNTNLLPLAIILLIVSLIALAYCVLQFILAPYIYTNNKDLAAKEIVVKSQNLMKKHKGKYILLLLSFIGWFLLIALICYILSYFVSYAIIAAFILVFYIFIRPYIIASEEMFYEDLDESIVNSDTNKNEDSQSNNSNSED